MISKLAIGNMSFLEPTLKLFTSNFNSRNEFSSTIFPITQAGHE